MKDVYGCSKLVLFLLQPMRKVVDYNLFISKLHLIKTAKLYCTFFWVVLISDNTGVDSSYCIPDVVWGRIIALLERSIRERKKKKKAGHPRKEEWMTERLWMLLSTSSVQVVNEMLYLRVLVLQVLYMTDRFQEWDEDWCFSSDFGFIDWLYMIKRLGFTGDGKLWMVILQKHLVAEKSTGPNPTDRAKPGTKRSSILVDGKGVPLSLSVVWANRDDMMKMTKATQQSIVIYRPEPTIRLQQHICCMNKG